MASEIKNIDNQVNDLIKNINKLKGEIEEYQTAYDAFRSSTDALTDIANANKVLTDELGTSIENLEKVDSISIINRINDTSNNLSKIEEELDIAPKINVIKYIVKSFEQRFCLLVY